MIKKKRILFILFTMILALFVPLATVTTVKADEEPFTVQAGAGLAIDAETGKILYNQNGDTPMGIASVTKILSIYVVLSQIESGAITWEDQVPISQYASDLSLNNELSNVPLYTEQTYSVQELYQASLIASANAGIVALAEYIAGSEPAFVDMMSQQLTDWGITDATLYNVSGLNNSDLGEGHLYPGSAIDSENSMSARDVALIAKRLITDFPDVLATTSLPTATFAAGTMSETVMNNWNWMLPGYLIEKDGVDGLKTGTTDYAGACFVGTINQNGVRIITVILNATDHAVDTAARFTETSNLMDYCYANWSKQEVPARGQAVPDVPTLNVPEGEETTVPISLKDNVTLWVPNGADINNLTITATIDEDAANDGLQAPVSAEAVVGSASVELADDTLGYVDGKAPTTDVVTNQSVVRANFFVRLGRTLSEFFSDLF